LRNSAAGDFHGSPEEKTGGFFPVCRGAVDFGHRQID
jgi:hypothetical protein